MVKDLVLNASNIYTVNTVSVDILPMIETKTNKA